MTTLLFVAAVLVIVVVPAFAMADDSVVASTLSVPDRTDRKGKSGDGGGTASHRGGASAMPVGGAREDGTSSHVGGLKWVNLSVSTQRRRGRHREKQYLLSPSRGFIPNGSVCGVIGPSGAGKSTLLSALGGTTPRTAGVRLTGSVWLEEWEEDADGDDDGEGEGDGGSRGSTAATTGGAKEKKKKRKASYLSTTDGEVALLQQDDAFFSMLTPRETIELAAFLQLPPPSHLDDEVDVDERKEEEGWDVSDRKQRKEAETGRRRRKPRPRRPTAAGRRSRRHEGTVDKILDSLGLKTHQHRRIGDRHVGGHGRGGLSGGERRRLSVGVELVTAPKVFLADEATTGLDSTQAERVVALMRNLAHERDIPCICTLHQPRASIWKKLDSVILMAPGGRICYMGERVRAVEYFTALGYPCPSETNPAEFMIDLVSVDTEDQDQARLDLERIDYLARCFAESNALRAVMKGGVDASGEEGEWTPPSVRTALWMNDNVAVSLETIRGSVGGRRKKVNFLRRFGVLLQRAWRQNVRDRRLNLFRLVASVGQAFLFSQIFRSVTPGPPTAKSIADRTALLSFGVINMSMLALMKTLTLFGKEKAVVTRERMRKQYSGFEYLLSKMLAEFPLDALFSSAFAYVLKRTTGLRCSRWVLCGTYSLMTVAGASLGFAIGSLTSNPDAAMAAGMPIMVVLMIVGIINPSGADAEHPAPSYIEWIKVASPIKWAIEALATAEYRGMEFAKRKKWAILRLIEDGPRMGGLSLVKNGDQVLDALGLSDACYPDLMKKLGKLVGAYLLVSLFGLTFCGPTFVQARGEGIMEDESDDTDGGVAMDDMMAEIGELRLKNAHSKPFVVEPHNIPTVRHI